MTLFSLCAIILNTIAPEHCVRQHGRGGNVKKKKKRVGLIILPVLLLLIAIVCVWQRNNLKALQLYTQFSGEELSGKLEDNTQGLISSAEDITGVPIRPLTDDEKAALRSGTVSREDLIGQLVGTPDVLPSESHSAAPVGAAAEEQSAASVPAAPAPSDPVPAASETAPPAPPDSADRDELARLIAEIYVLEAEYTGWLRDSDRAAIEEYNALPSEEQTPSKKYSIGLRYTALAQEKEKECDAKMAALESSIRAVLQRLGESESLVDDIHATYLEEKALQKAYYLSLH